LSNATPVTTDHFPFPNLVTPTITAKGKLGKSASFEIMLPTKQEKSQSLPAK